MTVEELIIKLAEFDPNATVVFENTENFVSEAGTDFPEKTEEEITEVVDLETRVVLKGD